MFKNIFEKIISPITIFVLFNRGKKYSVFDYFIYWSILLVILFFISFWSVYRYYSDRNELDRIDRQFQFKEVTFHNDSERLNLLLEDKLVKLKEKKEVYKDIMSISLGYLFDEKDLLKVNSSDLFQENVLEVNFLKRGLLDSIQFATSLNTLSENIYNRIPTGSPLKMQGRITSGYGDRYSPFTLKKSFHTGIDIAAPEGENIYALAGGKIIMADYFNDYGYTVVISHGGHYRSLYAHLGEIIGYPGKKIKKGDLIGKIGISGRSTGFHVHVEIRYRNRHINPYEYLFTDL